MTIAFLILVLAGVVGMLLQYLHCALAKTNADTSAAEAAGTFNPTGEAEIAKLLDDGSPELVALAAVVTKAAAEQGYIKLSVTQWQADRYLKIPHYNYLGAGVGVLQSCPAIQPLPRAITLHEDEDLSVYFKTTTASIDQGLILYLSYGLRCLDISGALAITSRRITSGSTTADAWTDGATTITDLDPAREYALIGGQAVGAAAAGDGLLAVAVNAPSFKGLVPMIPPSSQPELLPEFMPLKGNETISVKFYDGVAAKTPIVDLYFAEFPKTDERPSTKTALGSALGPVGGSFQAGGPVGGGFNLGGLGSLLGFK